MKSYVYSQPFTTVTFPMISREPAEIQKFDQFLSTYNLIVWMFSIFVVMTISMTFKLIHYVYQSPYFVKYGYAGRVTHPADFIILPISTLTEPDSIPWFPKHSAGIYNIIIFFLSCFLEV